MKESNQILKAINRVHQAIAAAGIAKNGSAEFKTRSGATYSFSFQKLDDIYMMISPLLAEEGIICMPFVVDAQEFIENSASGKMIRTKLKVLYTFTHLEDQSFVQAQVIGEDSDSGSKSATKAMSAAHKIVLKQIFQIPTPPGSESKPKPFYESHVKQANKTSDAHPPQPNSKSVTSGQCEWLKKKLILLGMNISDILNHYNIDDFIQLPINKYEDLRVRVLEMESERFGNKEQIVQQPT